MATKGVPLQIVSIHSPEESHATTTTGGESGVVHVDGGDSFVLLEENLVAVLNKVPADCHVSVISVVGAFRTGKSFLLNLFLRYLRDGDPADKSESWMTKSGPALLEGNNNSSNSNNNNNNGENSAASFAWRGGQERQTTGMWMWSEPFIRVDRNNNRVAVLLMDTQGMFDNDTSMALTAQIFGLSTFVSSYQIYNVDKRLQEDNLQHLALFSEFGRLACKTDDNNNNNRDGEASTATTAEKVLEAATEGATTKGEKSDRFLRRTLNIKKPPFQRIQFLVRDWQNFTHDFEIDESSTTTTEQQQQQQQAQKDALFISLREEMSLYLNQVLKPRDGVADLASTREQITRCFDSIDLFLLPHPGSAVTKRNFSGEVALIDPFFRFLVDRLVREVFEQRLEPKTVNHGNSNNNNNSGVAGRAVSGSDLLTYFQVYVKTFQSNNSSFPKAMTLLDATAEANNRTALQHSIDSYISALASLVNEHSPFLPEKQLLQAHLSVELEALRLFDNQAGLGSEASIALFRQQLQQQLQQNWGRFKETNALKDPLRAVAPYILPSLLLVVCWATASLLDQWCTSDHCEFVEDTFERMYMFAAIGILAFAYNQQIKDANMYSIPLAVAVVSWLVATVINTSCNTTSCVKAGDAFERVYLFLGFSLAVLFYKNFKTVFDYAQTNLVPLLNQAQQQQATVAGAKKNN